MTWLLRAALLLLVTVPLFVVTRFHAPIWQIFLAAAAGSALGHLAVRLTRGRPRFVSVLIAAVGLLGAAGSVVVLGRPPALTAAGGRRLIVVANGQTPSLTLDDGIALQALDPVAAVAPFERVTAQLVTDGANWSTSVVGTTPSYLDARGWHLASGAPFSESDVSSAARVAILGHATAKQLFGATDGVGQRIRIKNVPITVVGILAPLGQDDDDVALVPRTTFERLHATSPGPIFSGQLLILPRDGAPTEPIRALLRARHRLPPDAADDFVLRAVMTN